MRAEIVVEPALDSPGDWYWAVKVDGGIYADGTAENLMVAQSRASDVYQEWKAMQA